MRESSAFRAIRRRRRAGPPSTGGTVGPFTVHVTYRRDDGGTTEWHSRAHRKGASLLSRAGGATGWWAPRRASWWIAVLFTIGSACFAIGPFPGFVQLVGAAADAAVFFVGSLFFTAAAALQYLEAVNADRGPARHGARRRLRVFAFEPHRIDWWATVVQLAGTLFFNLSTYDGPQHDLSTAQEDHLIWAPDVFGCACFLIASALAGGRCPARRRAARGGDSTGGSRRSTWPGRWPSRSPAWRRSSSPTRATSSTSPRPTVTTVIGALGFLAGALLMLVEGTRAGIPDPLVPAGA